MPILGSQLYFHCWDFRLDHSIFVHTTGENKSQIGLGKSGTNLTLHPADVDGAFAHNIQILHVLLEP